MLSRNSDPIEDGLRIGRKSSAADSRAELSATVDVDGSFHVFAVDAAGMLWQASGHSRLWSAQSLQYKVRRGHDLSARPLRHVAVDKTGSVVQRTHSEAASSSDTP